MAKQKQKCPRHRIEIPEGREVVLCDAKKYEWQPDKKGYFLVKINQKKKQICCGFVDGSSHRMKVEFRASDPDKIIREIAGRRLCSLANMGYIASELMLARQALDSKKKYIQR